jgi:F-type H+-transporting ATPase subunit epsilon
VSDTQGAATPNPHELRVSVVSADQEVWSGDAKQVIARTLIGQIGILAGHEPVLAILGEGEVRITTTSGELITAQADDGFLSVDHDTVTVVARNAALA